MTKELKVFHHWELEETQTQLDYKPVSLVRGWLNRVWFNRLRLGEKMPEPRGFKLIDQIMNRKP